MDNEKFTRYWTKVQPVVRGYVNSIIWDFHEAEDVVQDVAVILLKKFEEYDEKRPFQHWALGVARNRVLNLCRSHKRSRVTFSQELVESVADVYEEILPELSQRTILLRECITNIKGKNREVLMLCYEGALKPRQIAKRLGLPGGTIRAILARMRGALRRCINDKIADNGLRA